MILTIVHREAFHQKRGEAGPGASSKGVEDEETLETGARVNELPDPVKNHVDDLLPDGVVAASVVVGGVLLPGHQLLRVEELTVGSSSNLVNHRWLKVDKDGPGDVLASPGLGEEGVEGVISATNSLVRGHLARESWIIKLCITKLELGPLRYLSLLVLNWFSN